LLPNPYYFKLAPTSWAVIRSSLIDNFTESKGYFLVLLMISVFSRKSYTRIFSLCGFLLLLAVYAPHNMHMNYGERFYFQVAFPILLFFLIAEDVARIARTATVITAILLFSVNLQFMRTSIGEFFYWTQSTTDLGRRLTSFTPDHSLITADIGAIPYYSNWTSYDSYGLGTYRIIRVGLTVPLLRELRPDLILFESIESGPEALNNIPPGDMYAGDRAERDYIQASGEYEYVGVCTIQGIYDLEYLRKDTPQHDEIVRALRENMRVSADEQLSVKDLLLQKYVPWRE
jgi:hypothetical protein